MTQKKYYYNNFWLNNMSWLFGGKDKSSKKGKSEEEIQKESADHARNQRLKKLAGAGQP